MGFQKAIIFGLKASKGLVREGRIVSLGGYENVPILGAGTAERRSNVVRVVVVSRDEHKVLAGKNV